MSKYPLGTNLPELERLRFQHEIWGSTTSAFLDRIGVVRGARVLDLGSGPGFVAFEIAERVGREGAVIALDESPVWMEFLRSEIAARELANVRLVQARLQEVELEPASLDVIFARWVLSFVPEPEAVVARLARALKPGGVFAFQDYNHEGISIFPESDGFRAVIAATRETYRRAGGDMWVAGRAAKIFATAGLEGVALVPHVKCGGPESPAFRWADRFFPPFSSIMRERGVLASADEERFLREWDERKRDPTSLFFSPYFVDCHARKPRV